MTLWEKSPVEEDIELPEFLYDLETDEMVEWLSEGTREGHSKYFKAKVENHRPESKEDAHNLILHYIERRREGEEPDARVSEYVLSVLERLTNEKAPLAIGKGEKPISFSQERWRSTVVKVLIDLGATQSLISSMLIVSERTVNSWYSYAKRYASRDSTIYWHIMSYLNKYCVEGLMNQDYRLICSSITSLREIEYKSRR